MGPFLTFFKKGANMILDNISRISNSPIANYVLVTYADPDVGPAMITKDKDAFRASVQSIVANISAGVNLDCDELAISAIKMAVENALPNSYVYVMTDACAKDYYLGDQVVELVQRKMIRVMFLLMHDICLEDEEENLTYKVYEKIAEASSGQLFVMSNITDVSSILNFVNTETVEVDVVDLETIESPSGYNQKHMVEVDASMKKISAVVSGRKPELYVINPAGKVVTDEKQVVTTLNLTNIKAIEVLSPETGEWTFVHGSDGKHTSKYAGVSKLTFDYGFSSFTTNKLSDTTSVPVKGSQVLLLIGIKEENERFEKLEGIDLVDTSNKILLNLPFQSLGPEVNNLYETIPFLPPNSSFYIRIVGLDKDGNTIRRSSSTPIQPQMAGKPSVEVNVKEINAVTNVSVKLICFAKSLIPLYVRWYKGSRPLQQDQWFIANAELEYVIHKTDETSAGIYTCVASNDKGSNRDSVTVNVKGVRNNFENYEDFPKFDFELMPPM
ncbi:hemicentin-1-like [Arctopsyche grandis]|uniref:hemicentin-1-like n=1 Tax=Arctopsyche grandis TaxID=121162 RepID=UPI00406D6BD2